MSDTPTSTSSVAPNFFASAGEATPKEKSGVDTAILEEKLGYLLRLAERAASRDLTSASGGLTAVQYSMLALVATNEGMAQGTIGEALNMDRASTMAVMDKLEQAGLIERRKSTVDRRMHAMFLTDKGREEFPRINANILEADQRVKDKLPEEEQAQLVSCLLKLIR